MKKFNRYLYLSFLLFFVSLGVTKLDSKAKEDDKELIEVEHHVSEDGGFISDEYGVKFKTKVSSKKGLLRDSTYPEKYDLRNVDGNSYLTSVKNQSPYGSCWTFGTLASAESGLLKKGKSEDLSEYHLAYYTYHDKTDVAGISNDTITVSDGTDEDWFLDMGGNYDMSANTLASWCGAVDETVAPYPSNGVLPTGFNPDTDNKYVLRDMYFTGSGPTNINNVKELIWNYGAVGASIYFGDNANYYVKGTGDAPDCYCYIETAEDDKDKKHADHAVAIVGWDDNFSKDNFKEGSRPDADGAWLIRNSWGEGFKDYFYISYYDSVISEEVVYAYVMEDVCKDDNIYQNDGISITEVYYPVMSDTCMCNVYTARDDELLEAVSTNLMNSNVNYEIQIYVNPTDDSNPLSGTPMLDKAQKGNIKYAGIKKIDLTKPVRLNKGDKFAVVIKVADGDGEDCVYSSTCCDGIMQSKTVNVTLNNEAAAGESFILDTYDTSLDDISDYTSITPVDLYDLNEVEDLCFRLKAFTKDIKSIDDETVNVDFSEPAVGENGITFTGEAIEPKLALTDVDYSLIEGVDYELSYENNLHAGTATVTATGIGMKYKGSVSKTFTINPMEITEDHVTVDHLTYNGEDQKSEIVVRFDGIALVNGKDYTVVCSKAVCDPGQYDITIGFFNDYFGVLSWRIYVHPAEISDAEFDEIEPYTYTGEPFEPKPVLRYNGEILEEGEEGDYVIKGYRDNVNAGVARIQVEGRNNFSGFLDVHFMIKPAEIGYAEADGIKPYTYTGEAITPKPVLRCNGEILEEGEEGDYVIEEYINNVNAGIATIHVTGRSNFTDGKDINFEILPTDIKEVGVDEIKPYTYTGKAITPKPVLRYNGEILEEGEDYTLVYINNINAGTATIHVTGKNNFISGKYINFEILPADIKDVVVDEIKPYTYTGKAITPKPVLRYNGKILEEGEEGDYVIEEYINNINPGTATIHVTGKNNFTNGKDINFEIPADIKDVVVDEIKPYTYTGKAITPKPVVTWNGKVLEEANGDKGDYKLEYVNNVNPGMAKVTITGIKNFTGKIERNFEIKPIDIAGGTFKLVKSVTYNAKIQNPKVRVLAYGKTLVEGTDYVVKYANNRDAGVAKAVVYGMGSYSGTKTLTFTINKKSISAAKVNKIKTQKFKKKGVKPSPVVKFNSKKLKKGKDYTLSYKNNKKRGKATIIITGKGNFKGTKKVTFKIK